MKRSFLLLFVCVLAARLPVHGDITTGLVSHYPLTQLSGTVANDVVGGRNGNVNGAIWGNPGLQFKDGTNCYIPSDPLASGATDDAGRPVSSNITLAMWINIEDVAKGGLLYSDHYAFGVDGTGRLRGSFSHASASRFSPPISTKTSNGVVPNSWTHVAVTLVPGSLSFYINGALDSTHTLSPSTAYRTGDVKLGLIAFGKFDFGSTVYDGAMRDVRFYNRALSQSDVNEIASMPYTLDPAFAGLWVGNVELNQAREASTGVWSAAPAFQQRILIHVTSDGAMRLLREATLMRTRSGTPETIVVTQGGLLSQFDGITPRGGRMVGQRFSSSSTPVPVEGVRFSTALSFKYTLSASDSLNPFRHKYHPDLGTGRELGCNLHLAFNGGDSPSDHSIAGTLTESITGLHKTTLEARSPVTFTRVSTSGKLNQP